MKYKSSDEEVETLGDIGFNDRVVMEKRQRVQWLDLPTGLWTMIARHLINLDNTTFEIRRFRSVCKTWRSAHPLPQHKPFAIPLGTGKSCLLQTKIYRLEPVSHEPHNDQDPSISSSKGWIIMSKSVLLPFLNPFSGYPISNTPHTSSSDTSPRVLNIMNFKAVELIEAFNLSGNPNSNNDCKVVLFPSFHVEDRMMCALFHDDGKLYVRQTRDKKWTMMNLNYYDGFHSYHDIIIHKRQIYVIDNLGTIFWINPSSLKLVQFTQPLWMWHNGKKKKMVECGGILYVVDMIIRGFSLHEEVDIKVYKVNEESGRWEVVKNLGDVVFVLGKDSNFSLSAQDYHGFEGNCIYFHISTHEGRIFCFSLKDSMLKTPNPLWPCPSLFNH
ncbi:F-box protein At2g26160-like [Lotus japonicus]|uniref:F-box protein At2g26160-like n=1 Tax=Lotus japonicus TaxID=34305 RepID=UPI00258E667F|nr:F-box protein At2g26160-like [Lotus japonicus]